MTDLRDLVDVEDRLEWIANQPAFADPCTDQLIGDVVGRLIVGAISVTYERDRGAAPTIRLTTDEFDAAIDERYSLGAQLANGAEVPGTKQTSRLGFLNLFGYVCDYPRVAMTIAGISPGEYVLDSSMAVFCWAVLIPTMQTLLRPIRLRGDQLREFSEWGDAVRCVAALGFDVSTVERLLGPRSAYTTVTTAEQVARRSEAAASLQDVPRDLGRRIRAAAVNRLAVKHHGTLRADGTTTRKRVLTAPLRADLSASCLGDWEVLMATLGGVLAKDERIVREHMQVSSALDLSAVSATEHIARRLSVLRDGWRDLDRFAAALSLEQQGLPRLSDGIDGDALAARLSPETNVQIVNLWGAQVDPRALDRIVSCDRPIDRMLSLLSPAYDLWAELMHACWNTANGFKLPSRSEATRNSHVETLAAMGVPIDPDALDEITAALGMATVRVPNGPEPGIVLLIADPDDSLTIRTDEIAIRRPLSVDVGRAVFLELRERLTRLRRRWADAHLERFLERRWRDPMTTAAGEYERSLMGRGGKPPTTRQSANIELINLWFGGEIEPYFALIGHPRRHPQANRVISADVPGMVAAVVRALGIPDLAAVADRDGEASRTRWRIELEVERQIRPIRRALELGLDLSGPPGRREWFRSAQSVQSLAEALGEDPEAVRRAAADIIVGLLKQG